MADEENKLAQWDGKVGWGTIATGIMTVVVIGGIVAGYGSMRTASDNSTLAVEKLTALVLEVQKSNAANAERITRVEEQNKAMAAGLDRIERKVDALSVPKR